MLQVVDLLSDAFTAASLTTNSFSRDSLTTSSFATDSSSNFSVSPPSLGKALEEGYQEVSCKLLDYKRYLNLQEKLRSRRRELLLFCQHPPTITAGVESKAGNLLVSQEKLAAGGIGLFQVKRAGDYTAHEAGQCVIYPHIDLRRRKLPVSLFFALLLEVTALAIKQVWKIPTRNDRQAPGLYHASTGAKLVSIGVMFKAFFTSHGLALNICNNLKTFTHIYPCGYRDIPVANIVQYGGDPAASGRFIQLWRENFEERLSRNGHIGD